MVYKDFIAGVVVGAICVFLFKGCEENRIIEKPCPEGEYHVLNQTTDTTTYYNYKTVTDTVPFYDSIEVETPVFVTIPVYDTITQLNVYDNPYEDSLIVGTIHSKVDGVLVDQKLTYVPKFPKYILKTDSIFVDRIVTNTTELVLKTRQAYLGLEVGGGNNTFNISPAISFKDKKDNLFSYRYGLIDGTHNVGFKKLIKFK